MAEVDLYLEKVVELKGSDLHICAGRQPNLRIHGVMQPLPGSDLLSEDHIESVMQQIIPACYYKTYEVQGDADFAYSTPRGERFRVNVFRDMQGLGAVFRHIPSDLPDFDLIRLEDSARSLCSLNRGLVLVTGPTGSGKSTTLASMISKLCSSYSYHIVTIEDPVEFVYKSHSSLVHQRELMLHTKSYSEALKNVLRQDPDVILVGEMRDAETTRLAIEAAETGHLVFATLHTNSAYSTVSRIVNQFNEGEQELIRVMLAENLRGVICQVLLPREDGIDGRIAAREIMLYSVAGANLIRENKVHQIPSLIEGSREQGMISMNHSLASLVQDRMISAETAWVHSMDQKDLASRLERMGISIEEEDHV